MTDTLNSTGGEEDADDDEGEEKEEGYDGDIGYGEMEREEEKERNRDRDDAVGFLLDDVRRSLEFECKEEIDVRNFTDTAPKVPATCQVGAAVSGKRILYFLDSGLFLFRKLFLRYVVQLRP